MLRRLVLSVFVFISVFLQGARKMQNIHPVKMAYLVQNIKSSGNLPISSVKMTSLDQKHKIDMKVASLGVPKLPISFKGTKSSGKLPMLV